MNNNLIKTIKQDACNWAEQQFTEDSNPFEVQAAIEERFVELLLERCASLVYNSVVDGDIAAMSIIYEFDLCGARSDK